MEVTTGVVVSPITLVLQVNGTAVDDAALAAAISQPEQQYYTERMAAEVGWNTWLSNDMLTHALLPHGTVCAFRHKFTLDDAIGSHACSREALLCVCLIPFLSGVHCFLPVGTVTSVQTRKGLLSHSQSMQAAVILPG
jgi:hypothetical protein